MTRLKEAMLLIADDAPLGPGWLDHTLKGDRADHQKRGYLGQTPIYLTGQLSDVSRQLEPDQIRCFTARLLMGSVFVSVALALLGPNVPRSNQCLSAPPLGAP